jgi:hypothetical protein
MAVTGSDPEGTRGQAERQQYANPKTGLNVCSYSDMMVTVYKGITRPFGNILASRPLVPVLATVEVWETSTMRYSRALSRPVRSIFVPAILALAAIGAVPAPAYDLTIAPSYQFVDLGTGPAEYGYMSAGAMCGDQYVGYGRVLVGGDYHAMYWPGRGAAPIDLNPAGYTYSWAYDVGQTQQVGDGTGPGGYPHALMWSGTAESVTDLNPAGFFTSAASGIYGYKQVGYGTPTGAPYSARHALIWSGSAASAVDIHPANFYASLAYAVSGNQIVGTGGKYANTSYHALLWNTDTGGLVDLHAASRGGESAALATDGHQQVGYRFSQARRYAILWSGTAESAIDLTPAGYTLAVAEDVYGGLQVGYGATPTISTYRALLWSGSAASVVDLGQFAPAGYSEFYAYSIDASGAILGRADLNGHMRPVVWVPVPEPMTGLLLLGMAGWALARRQSAMGIGAITRSAVWDMLSP